MFSLPNKYTALVAAFTFALTACLDNGANRSEAEKLSPARTSPYQIQWQSLGRPATDDEVAAWDIDVRPDFEGLPPGQGSVEDGEALWIARCASCHGDFGDANTFFSPLVLGNITNDDIETGRVAALNDVTRVRTTLMKVSTLSTLWDYIHRAMPWNDPKSLSSDDVYALVAYLLSLGYIVDYDFVLSDENVAEVQARMPNRNGMTRDHGLWAVDGEPDVKATACMSDCAESVTVASFIPQFARNAHGNLQHQMRQYGPYQGIDTAGNSTTSDNIQSEASEDQPNNSAEQLIADYGCTACHKINSSLVGPAFNAVGEKYRNQSDARLYLSIKIREGGSGIWGGVMPPMPQVKEDHAMAIAQWLLSLQ